MTAQITVMATRQPRKSSPRGFKPAAERGIVLIVALILLVVMSLATAYSVRGAGSSELVANNTRTQLLAMQATEAALRYCETGVVNYRALLTTHTLVLSPVLTPVAAPVGTATFDWESLTKWDGSSSVASVTVIGTTDLVLNDTSSGLYKRAPECMAQFMNIADTQRVIVTARGFGPDVAGLTGTDRPAPEGSEVWLQSTLVLP